jgi:hypothetical protein
MNELYRYFTDGGWVYRRFQITESGEIVRYGSRRSEVAYTREQVERVPIPDSGWEKP